MGAIISSDYPGMDALQNRLTAARAANIGRLTAARGTLMDNLPRLNTKIKGASYVASAQFNLPTSRAWIELFSSTQAESCYLFMAFKRNYSAVDIGTVRQEVKPSWSTVLTQAIQMAPKYGVCLSRFLLEPVLPPEVMGILEL